MEASRKRAVNILIIEGFIANFQTFPSKIGPEGSLPVLLQ